MTKTLQIPENSVRLKPFGIYGGGQLGYMLAEAARRMGFYVVLYCQKPDEPACSIADKVICGGWNDKAALYRFAQTGIIGVACEFEQSDPAGVAYLKAKGVPTYTLKETLAIGRDRQLEKQACVEHGGETVPYVSFEVGRMEHLKDQTTIDPNAGVIVKTRQQGYDGKGQVTLPNMAAVLSQVWKADAEYIVEQKIDFAFECSVQVTRTPNGYLQPSQAVRNKHTNRYGGGMLEYTMWYKGAVPRKTEILAQNMAVNLAQGLGLVGVMTVEFFVMSDGRVIFNEFAPRPHNSFHAREASLGNQFDLYIASLTDRALVPIEYDKPFIMVNLIGDHIYLATELEALGFRVTDYRKGESRPDRKMGHATLVVQNISQLEAIIAKLVELGVIEHLFVA